MQNLRYLHVGCSLKTIVLNTFILITKLCSYCKQFLMLKQVTIENGKDGLQSSEVHWLLDIANT